MGCPPKWSPKVLASPPKFLETLPFNMAPYQENFLTKTVISMNIVYINVAIILSSFVHKFNL